MGRCERNNEPRNSIKGVELPAHICVKDFEELLSKLVVK